MEMLYSYSRSIDGGQELNSKTPVDTHAQDFLSALAKFVGPIIRECICAPEIRRYGQENESIEGNLLNVVAGQSLISALKEFVMEVTQNNSTTKNYNHTSPSKSGPRNFSTTSPKGSRASAATSGSSSSGDAIPRYSKPESSHLSGLSQDAKRIPERLAQGLQVTIDPGTMTSSHLNALTPALPQQIQKTELEQMTLTFVRSHVFNKMPIRLLAFDENGTNIQLIERDEIFTRILPRVYAETSKPGFQSEWAKVQELQDKYVHWKHRQDAMSKLFQEVIGESVRYAILSHTWIRDTPSDVVFGSWKTRADNPRGYAKITKFCETAAQNHLVTLGWIDTLCINKESSSELDESIRSMYSWYRGASVCVTYLSETLQITDNYRDSWFTRGWTLQELLAPLHIVFYNKNWESLGSGNDAQIQEFIERATTITKAELDLCRRGNVEQISISRRMQLACGRQVTREEDTSYSLMGILGVNITIAYGEGSQRAFYRLIQGILTSKLHVLDLFNRYYDGSNTLIPSSPELYSTRRHGFDDPTEVSGSILNRHNPLKPILLTHLGVRMPLLLVPALLSKSIIDKEYIPCGDLSGQYSVCFTFGDSSQENRYYKLLDRRLYVGNHANWWPIEDRKVSPGDLIRNFGIFNFGADSAGDILIPQMCAALSFYWQDMGPGNFVGPAEGMKIVPGPPRSFCLESARNLYTIPRDELGRHGLKLVSLYL
ncbi:hypothetical protein HYPSUDRAFT_49592 [Hypholoma sublateritium FD-334 SS-4]|uniref:Heterokaryon incompatibility domain-containing protein n=1 Tax=Hypholoma sublateritium (strain FD-334 SS-4) TaxID=945553 RepID=A0A0D2N3I9_HYPSF|nr:hypothetical protein HYPSUDRAFT_49592 [Hypholoma sublateritium FD-334 SS-4]